MKNISDYIYFFVGASGTGKSTLINYLNENFDVDAMQLSARPYLPTTGSYDQTLTDESQSIIVHSRTVSILDIVLQKTEDLLNNKKIKPVIFSRSPIDNIAYQNVLNKGKYLDSIVKKEIEILSNYAKFLYLPIEFDLPLNASQDIVRGTNEKVRKDTDIEINKLFSKYLNISNNKFNIISISGSKEERFKQLDNLFKINKINN